MLILGIINIIAAVRKRIEPASFPNGAKPCTFVLLTATEGLVRPK